MDPQSFFSQFHFNPELRGAVGIEREHFLTNELGMPVPRSPEFLRLIKNPAWTYELSACQVEYRSKPCIAMNDLNKDLYAAQRHAHVVARQMGARLSSVEVADSAMPLDVYPDSDRYGAIVKTIDTETLRAACRVAATHVHIGVGDLAEAIRVANTLTAQLQWFLQIGDHSDGVRLRLYRKMAPQWKPPYYESPEHFYAVAREQKFLQDPRGCYHLIRISIHGTVEVRAFGTTESILEIQDWVEEIKKILR